MTFRAWQVNGDDGGRLVDLAEEDLDGQVCVDIEFSSINFKDGLALTGKPGVISTPGLIAGIDFVGATAAGEPMLVNGHGIGEKYNGGLAERARVASDWLLPVPDAFTNAQAAAIGTAGFTAMLAVMAVERTAAEAGTDAGVLVTGAAGGVGSLAVSLLSSLGYRVTASTGRASEHGYLRSLGAAEILDRADLGTPGKPLQGQRWAAAIDSVGGATLANVLAQTQYGGVVASCGLAQSAKLDTTVMPFILRAVTLTGINSVYCPRPLREEAWRRLATDLDRDLLDSLTTTVGMADARSVAERILQGDVRGRTVVDVRN